MLITRYIGKNLVTATCFVVLVLTTVIWLTQSMKILELVADSDAPPSLFFRLVLLSLPKFLEIIMPIALVISILFIYNKLVMDNEAIVMRACGVDQMELARPALLLAAMVTCLLFVLGMYLSPRSTTQMILLREDVKTRYSAFLLREGVFNTFGSDLTVYLRARAASGDLYGLMIHDARDKKQPPVTITAKRGHVKMDQGVPTIVVYDGMRQQIENSSGAENGALSKLYFSQYTIEIKGLGSEAATRWRDTSERTLGELLTPDPNDARDRAKGAVFAAEIGNRLITPLNAVGFALIALCSVLLGPFDRRGQNKKVMTAAALVTLAQALNLALVSLMKKNIAFAPLFCVATLAPIALCFWLLHLPGETMLRAFLRRWRGGSGREASA